MISTLLAMIRVLYELLMVPVQLAFDFLQGYRTGPVAAWGTCATLCLLFGVILIDPQVSAWDKLLFFCVAAFAGGLAGIFFPHERH